MKCWISRGTSPSQSGRMTDVSSNAKTYILHLVCIICKLLNLDPKKTTVQIQDKEVRFNSYTHATASRGWAATTNPDRAEC